MSEINPEPIKCIQCDKPFSPMLSLASNVANNNQFCSDNCLVSSDQYKELKIECDLFIQSLNPQMKHRLSELLNSKILHDSEVLIKGWVK